MLKRLCAVFENMQKETSIFHFLKYMDWKSQYKLRVCFFHAVKQTDWDRKNKTASSQQANLQAQGGLWPIIKYRTEQSILIKDFHYEALCSVI